MLEKDQATGQGLDFNEMFKEIYPEEMDANVFTLVGKVFPVITAGKEDHYNSMTASGGGLGMLFMKPTTWCILQANRYTLALIEKEQTYTLSYFSNEYRDQILFLGSKSGRDSEKMKEVALTSLRTPAGNMAYKEAKLIMECRLTAITTPNPNDFFAQDTKDYINDVYVDTREYRKFVFGEMTYIWTKR